MKAKGTIKSKGTIHADSKCIKAVMDYAIDAELTTHTGHRKEDFTYSRGKSERNTYFPESTIEKIYAFDAGKKLNVYRDSFIIACETGLRFSDWSKISLMNMFERDGHRFLKVRTQKTGSESVIICSDRFLQIVKSHGSNLPKLRSYQTVNRRVKDVCKAAGFELPKGEVLHVPRRSFLTNRLKEGFDIDLLSKMVGHATTKQTKEYLKLTTDDLADEQIKQVTKNKLKMVV